MRNRKSFLISLYRWMRGLGCAGQSATEYMLVIAVMVIGILSAASYFVPPFKNAVLILAQNVSTWLTTNQPMANAQQ